MTVTADRRAIDILFVCTGNIVRSPMAEALLRKRLREAQCPARVDSAGVVSFARGAAPEAISATAELGIDLTRHRSRQLDPSFMDCELVIGMERRHVREAVMLRQDVWSRAFTLKELVRRGRSVGARERDEALTDWVAAVHAGRTRRDLLGSSEVDDIRDPLGRGIAAFEQTLATIDRLVAELATLLLGNACSGSQQSPGLVE